MEDLKIYLNSGIKDYSEGIELLKKYGGKTIEISFFTSNFSKMSENMLLKKLSNIYRIASQKGFDTKKDEIIKQDNKPIVIKRIHFSEAENELTQSKLLTNKLLSRNWNELDKKEKSYFKDNKTWFEQKKELLINNSRIESEIKSLHAQLSVKKNDQERELIADKLVSLKKNQSENWSKIDNFNTFISSVAEDDSEINKAELILKRNNLRSRVSKLENLIKDKGHKNYKKRVDDLNKVKLELTKIENKL